MFIYALTYAHMEVRTFILHTLRSALMVMMMMMMWTATTIGKYQRKPIKKHLTAQKEVLTH